ncbi:methylated-DNA/protein-cysteine methyltransferase [Paenibacillus curdlanolyticus YK9]|uniref:methylated-DNA--[protein]-cysteine S-methyltransferase n=1 Tax=Paenibacillus curdlanolyticus YK9 TaxID=717606 RepID=E0I854_9BACL|nr:methylated-DNA--[protein]-cysteine S-methyltransferase [Paenibacillus curdlanolyticus]EFM11359.1 methylated-DNA/protein-cysteine methyltransferase [Paenibacillus curdlanolyticus YK9]
MNKANDSSPIAGRSFEADRGGQTVYWSPVKAGPWTLHLAATAHGLCYVGSADQPMDEMKAWVDRRLPRHSLFRDDDRLAPYAESIGDYLEGNQEALDLLQMDLHGTPFQRQVWQALRELPYGCVSTYSDIAERIGKPSAVRAVGTAIGANPVLMGVPCHRVIGKSGALTGFRGGLAMKRMLLELEGAPVGNA